MKIDSHQHFWTLSRGDYDWLSPELGPIYRDFTPQDLDPMRREAGIDKTIVVQATDTVQETEFLLQMADQTDWIGGVVGWVDMEHQLAVETLERLALNPHFKGIRPMIQGISDDTWILRPALDTFFDALIEMELTFDALVLPQHLPHLLKRLDKHPDLSCVIDHAAKPALASGELDSWRKNITALARNTRAFCKFSGLVTEAGADYTIDTIRPASELLLEEFGAAALCLAVIGRF